MNKKDLVEQIIDRLTHDFAIAYNAAKAAHEAAIHEENIPDNEYDTLSLEASYLAQGQANRAQDIKRSLDAYKNLEIISFSDRSPIRLTALITLEDEESITKTIFIGPAAGGLKIVSGSTEIVVITPESPLGRGVLGKRSGDMVEVSIAGAEREFEIISVA